MSWSGAVLAVAAGVGWLYLLRGVGALDLGPRVVGALPLQQLAGEGAQPLSRLVAAWVPAGVVAGLALSRTIRSEWRRTAALALLAWVLLVVAGAASDAAAVSASVQSHLPAQLTRAGTWAAVALMTAGALLAERWPARRAG